MRGKEKSQTVQAAAYEGMVPLARPEDSEFLTVGLTSTNWRVQMNAVKGLERAVRAGARLKPEIYDRIASVLGNEMVNTRRTRPLAFPSSTSARPRKRVLVRHPSPPSIPRGTAARRTAPGEPAPTPCAPSTISTLQTMRSALPCHHSPTRRSDCQRPQSGARHFQTHAKGRLSVISTSGGLFPLLAGRAGTGQGERSCDPAIMEEMGGNVANANLPHASPRSRHGDAGRFSQGFLGLAAAGPDDHSAGRVGQHRLRRDDRPVRQ